MYCIEPVSKKLFARLVEPTLIDFMKPDSSTAARFVRLTILCGVVCLAVDAFSQSTGSPSKDLQTALAQPFVTVNGEAQSNARAEVLLREQLGRGVADSAELRKSVREHLINQAMMAQEARRNGLDKDPLVQAQMELAQQNILAQAWQQKVLSETVIKEDELRAEYAQQMARIGKQEYLVRHLLVAEEATAKLLIEKLQAGTKMADLAAEYSRDTSSKYHGGLTEWTNITNFLPPVAEAVAKLAKGKLEPLPVHSDAGWHVLLLEDQRAFTPPTLEAIKPQLVQIIAARSLEARAQVLKSKVHSQ